ncbi:PAS domain S-box protein [Candidatus Nitrospira bockiana]
MNEPRPTESGAGNIGREMERLKARAQALEQLLAVHEQTVIVQADQLAKTVAELRRQADELTRSDKIIRESEARFRLAMDAANLGTWDWDIVIDRVTCSDNLTPLFGLPGGSEVTYAAFLDAVHPDDRDGVARAVEQVLRHDTEYAVEFRTRWRDETVHWIAMKGKLYRSVSGTPVRMIGIAMDITDRRRSEEALRASEERYRLLFERNPNPMWVYDLDTLAFLEVNQAAVYHYGYSRDEFLAMTIRDIRPPEDVPSLLRSVAREKEGYGHAGLWRHRKKDGTIIDVEIAGHTMAFGDRRAELILARDVTEQTRAEQALRHSEEQFTSFMDNLPGFAWIKDAAGRYLYTNKYFESVFSLYSARWFGRTDHDVFPPDIADQFVENDRRVLASGHEIRTTETFLLQDGPHVGLVTKFPILRPGGVMLVGGISIDITDRKQAEEALRASEERFQVFMNHSPAIAFIKDEEGRHLYVNEPFARCFGKPVGDWIGKTDAELWPEDIARQFRETDRMVLQGDKPVELEEVAPAADGTLRHWLVLKFPFKDGSGKKVLAGIALDITQRKYLEEQLRQAQKMEAIGRLAGGVAHDFNNLLTVISGYSELLQYHLRGNETLWKYAEQVKLAGDRGSALTRQLLAFSRQQVLRPEVLDLNAVITDLLDMLQRLIGEHIVLETALDPRPAFVKTDPGQLEQVLLNLAINARDAMPDGGLLRIETAHVRSDGTACEGLGRLAPGPYVRLTVRDTGCGMDDVTQARLFEPFFTTKDQGKGTGLGLATVYGIVTQSQGAITVESEPDRGTSFIIYLPVSEAAVDAPPERREAQEPQKGSETVLVVEDQQGVRGFLKNLLRLNGYRVLEASDGEEALRICRLHPGEIQLLLTDIVMPGMSGRELAERLSGEPGTPKVLFMSGYTDDAALHSAVADSDVAFLQKPFSPLALTRKIREVLDAR